jgi:folate-dependent tRNA-U54 methylase TrmFO/GidA
MNVNFGIFSQDKITAKKKKDRRAMMSQLAQEEIKDIAAQIFAAEKD